MRRMSTDDDAQGKSVVIIDGGPSSTIGDPNLSGLFAIWKDDGRRQYSAFRSSSPPDLQRAAVVRASYQPRIS